MFEPATFTGAAAVILFMLSASFGLRGGRMIARSGAPREDSAPEAISEELKSRLEKIRETSASPVKPVVEFQFDDEDESGEDKPSGEAEPEDGEASADPEQANDTLMLSSPAPADGGPGQGAFDRRPNVDRALHTIFDGAPFVEVCGPAGSGKRSLVSHILETDVTTPQVLLSCSPQGAIRGRGQTLNSFFGLPNQILDEEALRDCSPKRVWEKVRRIIITDIALLRADALDAVDQRLRRARRVERPFGGVQMVLVGDYAQRPPVRREADLRQLSASGYQSPYAFSAKILSEIAPVHIRLDPIVRPRDPQLAGHLERLRDGAADEETVAALNRSCFRPHRPGVRPVILTGSRDAANGYNAGWLASLEGQAVTFVGDTSGEFEAAHATAPAPQSLTLKTGARVTAVMNDPAGAWADGAIGTALEVDHDYVKVRFDGAPAPVKVRRASWAKIVYLWKQDTQRIVAEEVGRYTQIPLRPAWALTIDNAPRQGLPDLRIDMGENGFTNDQAYAAVTRALTMSGLSLARPFVLEDFHVDPAVVAYYSRAGEDQGDPEKAALPWDHDLLTGEHDLELPLGQQLFG